MGICMNCKKRVSVMDMRGMVCDECREKHKDDPEHKNSTTRSFALFEMMWERFKSGADKKDAKREPKHIESRKTVHSKHRTLV